MVISLPISRLYNYAMTALESLKFPIRGDGFEVGLSFTCYWCKADNLQDIEKDC